MRVLYGLLGAGNGHSGRAREVIPVLEKYAEVDVAISGTDSQVDLQKDPKFRYHGLIFHLGKRGNLDYFRTVRDFKPSTLLRDIARFPMRDYDLLINDFEPITARSARRSGVRSVSLSHQASFYSENAPRPREKDPVAEFIIRHYAACAERIGLHFERYDDFIETPVIRKEVRNLIPRDDGHYAVYLPAYDDLYLADLFGSIKNSRWEIFSKRAACAFARDNCRVIPVENAAYLKSLEGCSGLLTGGGFEGPAEAIFLGKKVMMVPQIRQFEQLCNAEAARRLGVTVIKKVSAETVETISEWVAAGKAIRADFPERTEDLVVRLLEAARQGFSISMAGAAAKGAPKPIGEGQG